MLTVRRLVLAAALWPCLTGAQPTSFDPFPGGTARHYQFDLARNFYPTAAAAAQARRELSQRFARLGADAAKPTTGADALQRVLATADTLTRELGRQYAYLSLRGAINARDATYQQETAEISSVAEPVLGDIARMLGGIADSTMRRYVRAVPALERYRYAHARARQDREHQLDAAAERALGAVEAQATTWGPALFQTTLASTAWGTVRAPDGELDVRRQGNEIRNHADRAVREAGFRLGQAGIASRRDTYAFILGRTAATRNVIARQRRWPDYPTQAYAAGALRPPQVRALLEALAARSEVNTRYERLRIAEITRDLGYDTVHVWDLTAPVPGQTAPRFTIGDATRHIIAAAQPLGAEYVRELRALLDPANGRLDLVPRENRVDRPGFSTGSVGYPSMFFQGRFEGFVADVITFSHEAGHAVQNMLMDSAGVLPRYASGPSYFTESFATLSELLLLEHLWRSSANAQDRQYYLRRLLENALEVFRNGHESLVEQQLYDSAAVGRLLDADGLERLTQSIGSRFSTWFGDAAGGERAYAWVQPLQFYTRPLYRVNYVIARLLALRYLDMLRRDPVAFERQYGRLLANGYDAAPEELLSRFLGIEFGSPNALVDPAVRVIEAWLREAEGSS